MGCEPEKIDHLVVKKWVTSTKEVTHMKTKHYSTEQIIGILKECRKRYAPVKELCRKYGVSDA